MAPSAESLTDHAHGWWFTTVDGVTPGSAVCRALPGPTDGQGHHYDPSRLLLDPYARAIDNRGFAAVSDPNSIGTAMSGPRRPWTDTVLYETHVRGLTMRHPDVPAHLRGTYAAWPTPW